MIEVIGKPLHQWNTGRWLQVSDEATHWLLANEGDSYALRIKSVKEGEIIKVKIPDHLLWTNKNLIVQAVNIEFDEDDGTEKSVETLESASIPIRKAPRPENYIYEDDRRNYVFKLVKDAEDAIKKAEQTITDLLNAAAAAEAAASSAATAAQNAEDAKTRADAATAAAIRVTKKMDDCAVLVSDQDLDETEQKQARNNIGAVGQGETLDLKGKAINNVGQLTLAQVNKNGNVSGGIVSIRNLDTHDENENLKVLISELFGDSVSLVGLSPGSDKNSAVTKGQLEDAVDNLSKKFWLVTVKDGVSSKSSEEIITHIKNGGVAYLYADGLYLPLGASDGGWAIASFIADDGINSVYCITGNEVESLDFEYAKTPQIASINEQIGDIETALDTIIAIQNELLGTISFTINDEPHTAIFGMTWKRWCASEYNTIGAHLAEDGFVVSDIGGIYTGYGSDETPQYGDTVIVDGCEYYGM